MDAAERAAAYESPRPEIAALVPPGARRELDPAYAARARTRCDRVVEADVEALAPRAEAELGRFDCLVAADVLEHLVDPWAALRAFARLLEPGGTAVVSLPNVGHWSTYAHLARGTWPRLPEGVHDATHLRWFTLRDARDLLEQAGLTVSAVERRARGPWGGARA